MCLGSIFAWADSNGNLTVDVKAGGKRIHPQPEAICLENIITRTRPNLLRMNLKICDFEGAFGQLRDFLT